KHHYAHVFQVAADADNFRIVSASHWSSPVIPVNGDHPNKNSLGVGNAVIWHANGVRPASPAEIATQTVLPVMEGQIAVNQGAIATNEAAAVFWELIAEATGSTPAIMRALAGKNGSEFVWAA